MLASYLLDATRSEHRLEDLALEYLGYKAAHGRGRLRPRRQGRVARRRAGRGRAGLRLRARRPRGSARAAVSRPADQGATRRGVSDTRAAADSGAGRDRAGGRADRRCRARGPVVEESTRSWPGGRPRSFELAGGEFNINSPKQLAEILFDKLQLPVLKRTGTSRAPSTAVEVLEELALAHDLPRLILEWRALMKLKGTYIDALPAARESGYRPGAHVVQSGRGRDRPLEQQRSQPAEHSDPHGARPRDPTRVHRRTRPRADFGRLLADRTARARASGGRRDAHRRLPARATTSTTRRRSRCSARTAAMDTHELRSTAKMINYALPVRKDGLHALQGHRRDAAGGAGIHRRLLRRLPAGPRVHRSHARRGARDRQSSRRCSAGAAWCRN